MANCPNCGQTVNSTAIVAAFNDPDGWQQELSTVTEALAASTEARLLMAHTIADLRTENATLRAALKDALTVIARQRYGPRFQTFTDEGEAHTTR